MEKIIKSTQKILSSGFVSSITIIALVTFWILSSIIFINKLSFSVLTYGHSFDGKENFDGKKITKGVIVSSDFMAKDDNLGIILIPVERYVKPEYSREDMLLFRIREVNSKNWHITVKFNSGSTENYKMFPIGFSPIPDSKQKAYEFEIESLSGNDSNAIRLAGEQYFSGYQSPRNELFSVSFLLKKISSGFQDLSFILTSSLFLVPLMLYVLWLLAVKKKYSLRGAISFLLMLLGIINLMFVKEFYFGVLILSLTGWVLFSRESKYTFYAVLLFVSVWVVLTYLGINNYSKKLNIWTYGMLIAGFIQLVIENKNLTK
jgi:hypothetical protein